MAMIVIVCCKRDVCLFCGHCSGVCYSERFEFTVGLFSLLSLGGTGWRASRLARDARETVSVKIDSRDWIIAHVRIKVETLRITKFSIWNSYRPGGPIRR